MDNIKNVKRNEVFGNNKFTLPAKRQKCLFLKSLSMLFCTLLFIISLSTFLNPVLGQDRDSCETEKEAVKKTNLAKAAETKAKKADEDFNKLPKLGPKPAGNKDADAAKTGLDAAQIKWDKSKDALNDAKKKLEPGITVEILKQDTANKNMILAEKQEKLKNKDTKSYNENRSRIAELQGEFRATIKDFKRSTAGEIFGNSDYKNIDFSKNAIANCTGVKAKQLNASEDMVRGECYLERANELLNMNRFKGERISELSGELQNAVTAIGASGVVSSTRKESPNETIGRAGPLLQTEIEKTQTALKDKYDEYVKLDNGIGILLEESNALRSEIKTLENQLKPITEAEKNENDAKTEYDKAEKKWKEADKNVQDVKKWEEDSTKRKKAENKMNDAAAEKTKADTEKANAENADAVFKAPAITALNAAKTVADLNTLDARMATLNRDLLREASNEVLANNAKAAEYKQKIEQARNNPKATDAQKTELLQRWRNYFRPIVRPHYVGKRNEAEATRLRGIKDGAVLQNFKCVKEVHEFIIELNQAINKVMALTVSKESGTPDFGNPNEENILIPDEFIPPLEEDGSGETPTDEVPDDLVKNTSEVKVFNVRPGQWLSTGIQLKKGQYFSITAKGLVTREKDRTWGPDGYYFIGFMAYTLKALVGDKLFEIRSNGGGTAPVDGELKLGITSTYEKIGPNDSKLQGSFVATVTIDGK